MVLDTAMQSTDLQRQFVMLILASRQICYNSTLQAIQLHHHWIQWAISTATLPCLIWILYNCHVVVKLTFLLGELKENTLYKPLTVFNQSDIKLWGLNKLPYGLKQAEMPQQ
jgi:hypothetical protein